MIIEERLTGFKCVEDTASPYKDDDSVSPSMLKQTSQTSPVYRSQKLVKQYILNTVITHHDMRFVMCCCIMEILLNLNHIITLST